MVLSVAKGTENSSVVKISWLSATCVDDLFLDTGPMPREVRALSVRLPGLWPVASYLV